MWRRLYARAFGQLLSYCLLAKFGGFTPKVWNIYIYIYKPPPFNTRQIWPSQLWEWPQSTYVTRAAMASPLVGYGDDNHDGSSSGQQRAVSSDAQYARNKNKTTTTIVRAWKNAWIGASFTFLSKIIAWKSRKRRLLFAYGTQKCG